MDDICPLVGCDGVRKKSVCGSNGFTYKDKCEIELENCDNWYKDSTNYKEVKVLHKGKCEKFVPATPPPIMSMDKNERCKECNSEPYDPVCGSDDITYKNLCFLDKMNCENQGCGIVLCNTEYKKLSLQSVQFLTFR